MLGISFDKIFNYMQVDDALKDVPWTPVLISIGLFIAAFVINQLIKRYIRRAVVRKTAGKERTFASEFWGSEGGFVIRSIKWIVWLIFIGSLFFIWADYIGKLFTRLQGVYAPVVKALIIIMIMAAALKASRHLIRMILRQIAPMAEEATPRGKQRIDTLYHVFTYGSSILIVVIASLMLLSNFGIDLKAVLATVGIASVAIGFGAQSLVKDIFSGIFIIIEDQFAVGDMVMIGDQGGIVERITLRITQLRNTQGMLITIPNGEINTVKNLTSEWSRVDYTIGVAYETDLDHAMEALMDEAAKLKQNMPDEIIEEPERLGVDEFEDSAITLRVWIKTRPLMQWKVKRELNRRVHKRFEAEGIDIPFPQRTLSFKAPQEEALLAALSEGKSVK